MNTEDDEFARIEREAKMDDRIKAVYEEYGRIVTGKEYALIHAIAEAVAPQRTWVGLTEEDCDEVERWVEFKEEGSDRIQTPKLIRYIEAKLKEKNT